MKGNSSFLIASENKEPNLNQKFSYDQNKVKHFILVFI